MRHEGEQSTPGQFFARQGPEAATPVMETGLQEQRRMSMMGGGGCLQELDRLLEVCKHRCVGARGAQRGEVLQTEACEEAGAAA